MTGDLSQSGALPEGREGALGPRTATPSLPPFRSRQIDALLEKAASVLATSSGVEGAVRRLADVVVPQFADWCAIPLLDDDRARLAAVRAREEIPLAGRALLSHVLGSWALRRAQQETRHDDHAPLVCEVATHEWLRSEVSPSAALALSRTVRPRSVLFLPLVLDGQCLGALLLLGLTTARPPYTERDLPAARHLSLFAASAIRNARVREALTVELTRRHCIEESLRESLSTIGTLSSGLGHDLGNVLHALRLRLDSLRSMELPEHATADVRAIVDVMAYLHRLTNGLRLLAGDVRDSRVEQGVTRLGAWWTDVQGLLRTVLPPQVTLRWEVPPTLPPLRMPPVALTQVMFNILQQRGQALEGRSDATIRISARRIRGSFALRLGVHDNGTPMRAGEIAEVLSVRDSGTRPPTGLGLPVAVSLVRRAGGEFSISARANSGTSFVARLALVDTRRRTRPHSRSLARVTLGEPQLVALVNRIARRSGFLLSSSDRPAHRNELVWITDLGAAPSPDQLREYVNHLPSRMVIVLHADVPPVQHPRIRALRTGDEIDGLTRLLADCQELAVRHAQLATYASARSAPAPD